MELVGRVPEMRQRDLRDAQAGQKGSAELEDLGAETELAALDTDVAEVDEGEQEPAGCCASEPGRTCHVTQGQGGMIGVERANHRQPTLQRLHEIRLTIDETCLRNGHPAAPGLAASSRRSASSSSSEGGAVVRSSCATRSSQPVASLTASTSTPG